MKMYNHFKKTHTPTHRRVQEGGLGVLEKDDVRKRSLGDSDDIGGMDDHIGVLDVHVCTYRI